MMKWVMVMVVAMLGCKSENARKADHAAREVTAQREELGHASTTPRKVAKEAGQLVKAEQEFEFRRHNRVLALRAEHSVIATQPMLISTMARSFPLTDDGRAQVNEKLTVLQMRLDDTKNMIEALDTTDASLFQDRDDAVRKAMDKLEDARHDAWKTLENAPRTDRTAS